MRRVRFAGIAAIISVIFVCGCKPAQGPQAPSAAPTAVSAAVPPVPSAAPISAAAPASGWNPGPAPDVHVSLAPLPTQHGDVPGGQDVAFLKRFQSSQIIGYLSHSYDRLSFFDSSGSDQDNDKRAFEGTTTRIVYRVPVGHTALEVLRNYEDLANSAGLARTSEIPCTQSFSTLPSTIFDQLPVGQLNGVFQLNATVETPYCYFTAQGVADGQPLTLGVLVAEKHGVLSATGADGKPMTYMPGEVVALVDLVVSKPVQNQMVTVTAADMADALASKGMIDLYGIYFDTDKTTIKPESSATLDQVANLLKIDRSLKLEVSGHTDNSGTSDHNMTLSQGRAQAVVQALVSHYGVDPGRLVAKGYGDTKPVAPNTSPANMAKNRRVELRKL